MPEPDSPPAPDPPGVTVPISPSPAPAAAGSKPTASHYGPELPLPEELQVMLGTAYVVESFLGQGGMGAVYRGLQMPLRRPVAIKILAKRGDGVEDGFAFEERFKREAYAMASLTHPHIVQVYDCGDAGEHHLFISMELVEGGDLSDAIKAGHVTPDVALKLIPQICDALEVAHAHGIVHRDIKPANIFLTKKAQLLDVATCKELSTWSVPCQLRSSDFDVRSEVSPDGRHLAIGVQDRTKSPDRPANGWPVDLWVVDTDSMKATAQWRPNFPLQLYSIAWLDADRFLVSTSIKAAEFLAFDLRKPTDPPVSRRSHAGLYIGVDPSGQWLVGNMANTLEIAPTADLLKAVTLRDNAFAYSFYFAGNMLFFANTKSSDILGFDLRNRALVTELHSDTNLERMSVSSDGSFAVTRERKSGDNKYTLVGLWRLRGMK